LFSRKYYQRLEGTYRLLRREAELFSQTLIKIYKPAYRLKAEYHSPFLMLDARHSSAMNISALLKSVDYIGIFPLKHKT
jgi:hypothetical protein